MKKALATLFLVGGITMVAAESGATPITFAVGDETRSASATFTASGGSLEVTVANASARDARVPTDILTAILFNINANLTPVTATAVPGSYIYALNRNGTVSTIAGTDVSGEWAYKGGISTPGGNTKGISSAGLGLFGGNDLFNPNGNLAGPVSPDGLQYGIAPAGDNPLTGNGDYIETPLLRNAVRFLLSGVPDTIDLRYAVTSVDFVFGTGLDSTFSGEVVETVPEPASIILMLLGFTALSLASRRLRSAAASRS